MQTELSIERINIVVIGLRSAAPGTRLAVLDVVPSRIAKQMEQGEIDLSFHISEEAGRFSKICDALGKRLDGLRETAPIPFRPQNDGAYNIPGFTLRSEVAPDQSGLGAHIA